MFLCTYIGTCAWLNTHVKFQSGANILASTAPLTCGYVLLRLNVAFFSTDGTADKRLKLGCPARRTTISPKDVTVDKRLKLHCPARRETISPTDVTVGKRLKLGCPAPHSGTSGRHGSWGSYVISVTSRKQGTLKQPHRTLNTGYG